ncbi:MAG: glycoside hydrolase family 2 TIM barrel-domain containing protein [Henriciella sp.]|nr:glycoside hydrolase family 2 TIM barrel-domain containing protein [Henriciella sp.]
MHKILIFLAFLFVVPTGPTFAQTLVSEETLSLDAPYPLTNVYGRTRTDLSGQWHYAIDPYRVPERKPRTRRNFWEDTEAMPGGELMEYEWASADEMTIPGAWNRRVTGLDYYDGLVWFQRDIAASPEPGKRYFLYFEAVNYRARVWLNGEKLGEHEGGFTPFAFEVTAQLQAGENSLVVAADSAHDDETLPARDFDWKNYGGITRPVHLVETPSTYVHDYFVRLEDGEILADVSLEGATERTKVEIEIPALAISLSGRTDVSGQVTLSTAIPEALQFWSPKMPQLYDVTISAGDDEISDRIGFRTIETQGREVLLNGDPIWLAGISVHEEALDPDGARALSWGEARALLSEAKALGANFVRLAHYPHTERMTRLADEIGLMVWSEVPIYWEDVSYHSDKTLALARRMMAENQIRDRNRASIIVWSVANETPIEDDRTVFLRTLIADTRARDATRLISAALNKNTAVGGVTAGQKRVIVEDPLGADLDLIAVNQYEGWYGPRSPDRIAEVSFENRYDKPMIFSEFGAGALFGHRGPKEDRWTEDYQAWLYEETFKLVDRTPGVVGTSPWLLKDFRSPRRWHGRFQDLWNRKGLINETGERKRAFDVVREYYTSKTSDTD